MPRAQLPHSVFTGNPLVESLLLSYLMRFLQVSCSFDASTVSGQNTIGRELTLLAFIQHTVNEHYIAPFNWLLKLQPAVMLQDCRMTAGCNSTNQLLHTVFCFFLQPTMILTIDRCI